MKRVLSPAFFVLAAAMFALPFVTVSCNADALQGLSELGGEAPPTDLPTGDIEILSATGWQIITDSADLSEEASSLGGEQASTDPGDLSKVQPFAIAAFGLAVLGIFLSLLRGKVGPTLALVLGLGGAVALFLMKNKFEGGGGAGALGAAGLDISWKPGFWAALGLLAAAAIGGLIGLVSGGAAPAVVGMPPEYGAPPPGMPPPAPPAGESPPPPAPPAEPQP